MLNYQRVLTVWSPYFTVFGVLFPTCSCFRPPSASLSSLWAPTDYARTSGQGGNHSKYIFLAHTQYVYVYSIKRFCNHPVNGFCHGSTALDPPEKKTPVMSAGRITTASDERILGGRMRQ